MLINEFAQWGAILFLGILTLGLLRQLGQFIIPRREQLLYRGPDIGSDMPPILFDGIPVERFSELINGSARRIGFLAVLRDRCSACNDLIEIIERVGGPSATHLAL